MSDLIFAWETKGYKKLVENILDGIRVEILKGQGLITQGTGAYWQLLIPGVGAIQINLVDVDGGLAIYSATHQKTSELLSGREPNLKDIKGIVPVKCHLNELPKVLARELSKLLTGSTDEKPSAPINPITPIKVPPKSSGINGWLIGGALGFIAVCGCLMVMMVFIVIMSQ